jgi:hypothetical protein
MLICPIITLTCKLIKLTWPTTNITFINNNFLSRIHHIQLYVPSLHLESYKDILFIPICVISSKIHLHLQSGREKYKDRMKSWDSRDI